MSEAKKYLDYEGLQHFYEKLQATFALKDEGGAAEAITDAEIDDIISPV